MEHDTILDIEWFESNYMKLNEDEGHFLLSGYKHDLMFAKFGQNRIWESETQKLLGVTIGKHLKIEEDIVKQCKKAGQKLSPLTRVCNILDHECWRTLMKGFIESHFGYCPLSWMLINHLHEISLRMIYNDYESSSQELLELDNSVSIHHKNIRLLAIELF